jgi:DNA-binding XRE family transcriptional regulator
MMPKTRITPEQKEEIQMLYASGAFTQVQLADKFGLRQGTISAIVKKSR